MLPNSARSAQHGQHGQLGVVQVRGLGHHSEHAADGCWQSPAYLPTGADVPGVALHYSYMTRARRGARERTGRGWPTRAGGLFDVKTSCDNSCDNSRRSSACRGHSRSLATAPSRPANESQKRQNRRSDGSDVRVWVVARGGVEPPTFRFSVGRSYQLSYLAGTTSGTIADPSGLPAIRPQVAQGRT